MTVFSDDIPYIQAGDRTSNVGYPEEMSRHEWLSLIEERRNPFYEYPPDEEVSVWRYMDFSKFVSLLDTSALFFCNAELLGDPFEGSVSQNNLTKRSEKINETVKSFLSMSNGELDGEKIRKDLENSLLQVWPNHEQWCRRWTFINCWHVNEGESAAMWRLYAKSNEAIAVKSTFNRLKSCLSRHMIPPHGEPRLGMIKYLDYDKDIVSKGVHLSAYFQKRQSFSHERELRAVFQEIPIIPLDKDGKKSGGHPDLGAVPPPGMFLDVSVENLVTEVVIAPDAPKWLSNITKNVVSLYGFLFPVTRSSLLGSPVF